MYLLDRGRRNHKTEFSFTDFFPLDDISHEHAGVNIISMEQFLQETAMQGQLRNKFTGQVEYPPDNNRTDWDGQDYSVLTEWLRNVTVTPLWAPSRCLAVFPAKNGSIDDNEWDAMHKHIVSEGSPFDGPIPVDAAPMERMRELLAGRKELCVYNNELQQAPVLHFLCDYKRRIRMLGTGI